MAFERTGNNGRGNTNTNQSTFTYLREGGFWKDLSTDKTKAATMGLGIREKDNMRSAYIKVSEMNKVNNAWTAESITCPLSKWKISEAITYLEKILVMGDASSLTEDDDFVVSVINQETKTGVMFRIYATNIADFKKGSIVVYVLLHQIENNVETNTKIIMLDSINTVLGEKINLDVQEFISYLRFVQAEATIKPSTSNNGTSAKQVENRQAALQTARRGTPPVATSNETPPPARGIGRATPPVATQEPQTPSEVKNSVVDNFVNEGDEDGEYV